MDPPLGVWMAVAAVAALGWVIATVRNTMLTEQLHRAQKDRPRHPEQRALEARGAEAMDNGHPIESHQDVRIHFNVE